MTTVMNRQGEVVVDASAGEAATSEELLARVLDDATVASLQDAVFTTVPSGRTFYHRVRRGETLASIASRIVWSASELTVPISTSSSIGRPFSWSFLYRPKS